ncbi:MAG: T9SS type A sorting domain-containing protein [Bacteroidales bacterium]|nr:T9SS type A sorting domain-containing protein [Bacteroidales bacterium]
MLGDLYLEMGRDYYMETGNFAKSIESVNQAMEIGLNDNDTDIAHMTLGILYYYTRENEKAKSHLNQALRSERAGLKMSVYQTLYSIAESEKDYQQVVQYHKLFTSCMMEADAEHANETLQRIKSEYELKTQQSELESLHRTHDLKLYLIIALAVIALLVILLIVRKKSSDHKLEMERFDRQVERDQNRIHELVSNMETLIHYEQWIEGIGSTRSLLFPIQWEPDNGPEYRLVEVWHDEKRLYKNPLFESNDTIIFNGAEWYYEIENENGSITYQYMYHAGDTIVNDEPSHILVKINTLYDKGVHEEVTHEYVYERDGKLYWWNKTLEEFTVLYDFGAQEGDSWEIKVGTESLVMHVDAVEDIEYEGRTYRMLHVNDANDLFSGNIVCGIGHLTIFFPERLMDNGDGIRVEGLRCYWVENELVFKYGDEDCDAIHDELHGVDENSPSTGSGTAGAFTVYPNPTDAVLFVQTLRATSLHNNIFRITNPMGQTLKTGQITAETQRIDVSNLPEGMYFITFAGKTRKFVVR